jgi:hypothetical protein
MSSWISFGEASALVDGFTAFDVAAKLPHGSTAVKITAASEIAAHNPAALINRMPSRIASSAILLAGVPTGFRQCRSRGVLVAPGEPFGPSSPHFHLLSADAVPNSIARMQPTWLDLAADSPKT